MTLFAFPWILPLNSIELVPDRGEYPDVESCGILLTARREKLRNTTLKALGNSQTDDASKPELLQQIIKTIRGFLAGMYLGKK